jgi:phage-related protein
VADSLGEVFVEVMGDASPFADSITEDIGGALEGVEDEIEASLSGVADIADAVFDEVATSADGSASEMASSFDSAASDIQGSLDGIDVDSFADKVRENAGKIVLGAAGAGAAAEGLARKQRDAQVEALQLANALGMDDVAMLDLIASTSNATFPLSDVIDLMRIAQQRGIRGADALADFANFWDMVGDATGEAGTALGEAAVSLALVGIEAGNEAEALDALGFVMNNTSGSVSSFLDFTGRVGAELGDQSPSINEMAAALAALEDQGYDSALAQRQLRRAIGEAEGDFTAALEILGVSEEAYAAQQAAVIGSGDAILRNADIFAAARTPVERMTQAIEEQLFKMPMIGQAAGLISAPLTALGPAAVGFTHGMTAIQTISGGFTKALGAMRAGFVKLGAVILANPIFLIGALLIGIAILVWKFRDEILEAITNAWDFIKDVTTKFWEWLKGLVTTLVESVTGFFTDMTDKIRDVFSAFWNWYKGIWQGLFNFVRNIVNRVRDFVVNGFNTLRDRATGAVSGLVNTVRTNLNNIVSFVTDLPGRILRGIGNLGSLLADKGRDMIQGFLNGATGLLKNIGKFLLDRIPGWIQAPFKKALGIASPSKVFAEIGRDTMEGFAVGIRDEIGSIEQMMSGLGGDVPMMFRPAVEGVDGSFGTGGTSGRSVDVTMNIYNPAPEPVTASASREIRKLAAIGVFGD